MTQTVLHFVFTPSGAGCLSQALKTAGRDDQVISFFDDLSFGPINPPDSSLRVKWVENELGRTGWDDVTAESERFWREAPSSDHRTVAWLTRRSAKEYAGFLEWSWRMRDAPYDVVDLSNVKVSYRPEHGPPRPPVFAMSLGMLHPGTETDYGNWPNRCSRRYESDTGISGSNFVLKMRRYAWSMAMSSCPRQSRSSTRC
ncbi:DUF1835 domain-containing protein [Bradyrhizobium sp. 170]|uniref:DUF1835 domain-containing protein n=1 Tax=Bradyrhizobium sp. 170 TaxID=2782641 RepID=UPI001FFFFA25|nr:DUF1835 domain-containing protein [Bradyrhizobium sp. 170]UPK04200.1 DUF1835 domain-containing protein [Bradyrhizobium sp. 170]